MQLGSSQRKMTSNKPFPTYGPKPELGVVVCHKLSITAAARHDWHSGDVRKSSRCRVTAGKQQWQVLLRFEMQMNLIHSCKEGRGRSQAGSNCTQTDGSMQTHAQDTGRHTHARMLTSSVLASISVPLTMPPMFLSLFLPLCPSGAPSPAGVADFCCQQFFAAGSAAVSFPDSTLL